MSKLSYRHVEQRLRHRLRLHHCCRRPQPWVEVVVGPVKNDFRSVYAFPVSLNTSETSISG